MSWRSGRTRQRINVGADPDSATVEGYYQLSPGHRPAVDMEDTDEPVYRFTRPYNRVAGMDHFDRMDAGIFHAEMALVRNQRVARRQWTRAERIADEATQPLSAPPSSYPAVLKSEDIPPTAPDEFEPIMSTAEFRNEEAPRTKLLVVGVTEPELLPRDHPNYRAPDGEIVEKVRSVPATRKRPVWDREDLPSWIKDKVKVPKWWSWKFVTTEFVGHLTANAPSGQYISLILQGTDQNQRIGKAVMFRRLEFRLRFRNRNSSYQLQPGYNIDGVGAGSTTAVKGQINAGWIVPDSGPGTSALYGATATAPNGFAIVRGTGGYNAIITPIAESDPAVDALATVGYPANSFQAPATPAIANIPVGSFWPLAQVAGTPAVPNGGPNAVAPPAPIGFMQTIPANPPADLRIAQDYQTYGPKGFTVPASVGSMTTFVPPANVLKSTPSGAMSAVRVLIVWSRGDFTVASPPLALANYLDLIDPGFPQAIVSPYNMDELRGTFEVLADQTWTPQGEENETTIVEEGIRLWHPALYPDAGSGLASYGQILVFLIAPEEPTAVVEVDAGYFRLWYEDMSDARSALKN